MRWNLNSDPDSDKVIFNDLSYKYDEKIVDGPKPEKCSVKTCEDFNASEIPPIKNKYNSFEGTKGVCGLSEYRENKEGEQMKCSDDKFTFSDELGIRLVTVPA